MTPRSFKDFVVIKEAAGDKDWKADAAGPQLKRGFIPPAKLRPVIRAFLNSDKIVLQHDTGPKPVTMPKKTLYLVGGPVRDFIKGKSIKDLDLATNATPAQVATILSAAGFKRAGDRSGKGGSDLKLPNGFLNQDGREVSIEDAKGGDNLLWFIKGRDNSEERKVFVISAVVDGEEFEIATFRKDAKVVDGQAAVDFVDNPKEDAERRDLTINALYIELTKPDGENKTLYDPTRSGIHDLEQGHVKTVGRAKDRFDEDPLRVMRAIRFHCRFSKSEALDPEIAKAIPHFLNLPERVALERIRDEFLKGLLHPEVDVRKYLGIYKQTGLINAIFPGLRLDPVTSVPAQFTDKKDKVLALAWLLQHNPAEKVDAVLSPKRIVAGQAKLTGWQTEERRAVVYLLKLKEFTPDRVYDYLKAKDGTGLSAQQIRDWVEMFQTGGQPRRPFWSQQVKKFADYQRGVTWDDAKASGKDVCQACAMGDPAACSQCKGTGTLPPEKRSLVIKDLETDRFRNHLGPNANQLD